MASLTQARLHELLDYNPETGVFVWRKTGKGRKKSLEAGFVGSNYYIYLKVDQVIYSAHRLALLYMEGAFPPRPLEVDHVDGNRQNNAYKNLRVVTSQVNKQNKKKPLSNNTHGFMGVTRNGSGWSAKLVFMRKHLRLGQFATPEEAHAAYLDARRRLYEGNTL